MRDIDTSDIYFECQGEDQLDDIVTFEDVEESITSEDEEEETPAPQGELTRAERDAQLLAWC